MLASSATVGTLRKKFKIAPLQLWGKTGNLYFVSSIAGFFHSEEKNYIFIFIANDQELRYELDELQINKKYQDPKYKKLLKYAKKWRNSAWAKQEELLKIYNREDEN